VTSLSVRPVTFLSVIYMLPSFDTYYGPFERGGASTGQALAALPDEIRRAVREERCGATSPTRAGQSRRKPNSGSPVAGASRRTQGTTSTIGVNRVQRMTIGSNSLFDRVRRNGAYGAELPLPQRRDPWPELPQTSHLTHHLFSAVRRC
jgi:hypothetical protein